MKNATLMKKYAVYALVFLLSLTRAYAQQASVSGKITDETGSALPGVTILLKGTSTGTNSDNEGNYSLPVPEAGSGVLVFSFVGYKSQEVTVGNRRSIDLKLALDAQALQDVVVVGYGEQRRSDITGAVASVTPKEMRDLPVARVDQALQGRSPGVLIQNNDASPNASVSIRIRGSNSITGSNDALVVINGFIGGDLNSINPNDIENVEVLKDASATAIYGSRGANGVILITTKRGTVGKTTVQLNSFVGTQTLRKKLDLLSAGDYADAVNANRTETGGKAVYSPSEVAGFKANGGTDWQDQIFRKALQQSHQVSVAGGSDKFSYFVSGNYINNEGIIKNTAFERYSLRSNIEARLNDKLKVGLNLFLSKSLDHPTALNGFAGGNGASPIFAARLWAPTLPVYDAAGLYTQPSGVVGPHTLYNPLAMAVEPIRDNRQDITEFNTFLDYTIIKGLSARVFVAGRQTTNENSSYLNTKGTAGVGDAQAGIYNDRFLSLQNTNQLTYQTTFATQHSLNVTAVFEQQYEQANGNGNGSRGFATNVYTYNNLGVATGGIPYSSRTTRNIQSFLGRVNYGYADRYLASFSARSDASSVFGANNKRAFFPSAALAWRINNEAFLSGVTAISNLKLRASYGLTGNQGIAPYGSLTQLNSAYPYAIDGTKLTPGVTLGTLGNPDLRWEKTAQLNVGVDLALFANRLQFTADVYQKRTSDLLLDVRIPAISGYETVRRNVGEVENKGVELSLGGQPVVGDFKWNTSANVAINRNKVLALDGTQTAGGTQEMTLGSPGLPNFGNTIFLTVGQPMGVLKGYIQNGTWGTAEADQATKYGTIPGAPKYVDQNNDGKIDDKDIAIMGNTFPKFTYGWNNTFAYKGLELNVLIQGVAGNKIYNLARVYTDRTSADADATSTRILDRWTPTNQNTDVPSFAGSLKSEQVQSSRWLEDGSYLRFKNITLGYNLSPNLLSAVKLSAARIYVSGVNLVTFTKYTGYDPEARTGVDTVGGIDLASYPAQKSYTVGLNVTF
jgi:TonB-linked SusC/RagA family outer membrane protein